MRRSTAVVATVLGIATLIGCAPRHGATLLDANAAPASDLASLPGLDDESARRIVAARPYYTKEQLRDRRIVSPEVYERIQDRLFLGPPAVPEHLKAVPPQPET